jgi:hypothetical protein
MRRPDFHMFVERNRNFGWRDRPDAWRVVMQLRGHEKRPMSDDLDQDGARVELARLQSEAGKMLLETVLRG